MTLSNREQALVALGAVAGCAITALAITRQPRTKESASTAAPTTAASEDGGAAQSNTASSAIAQPRSWKSHLSGLDKMVSELLCEARLLASELNKGGDPSAVVNDPLRPTQTAERRLMTQSANRSSDAPAPLLRRQSSAGLAASLRDELGKFVPGKLATKIIGVCGMRYSGQTRTHAAASTPLPNLARVSSTLTTVAAPANRR